MASRGKLIVSCFNCQAYKSSTEYISALFNEVDILALQETWLMPNELHLPSVLHDNLDSYSISSMDISEGLIVGRPFGGLSFIWKKEISKFITIKTYDDSRILGLSLSFDAKSILVLNVYMPTTSQDGEDEFSQYIGRLSSIIAESDEEHICIIGDLNASPGSARFREVLSLCEDYQLKIADVDTLPSTSYSHINSGSLSRSWIDHCLVSENLFSSMAECRFHEDFAVSDHCPLIINFDITYLANTLPVPIPLNVVKWDFENKNKLDKFYEHLDSRLQTFPIRSNNAKCVRHHCSKVTHTVCIENYYNNLNRAIIECGRKVFGCTTHKGKNVPGWNSHVKELYSEYRRTFLIWRSNGSPRQGEVAVSMRTSRARFKLALRWCKRHEADIKAQAMASKLANKDTKGFWKDNRSMIPCKPKLP